MNFLRQSTCDDVSVLAVRAIMTSFEDVFPILRGRPAGIFVIAESVKFRA